MDFSFGFHSLGFWLDLILFMFDLVGFRVDSDLIWLHFGLILVLTALRALEEVLGLARTS